MVYRGQPFPAYGTTEFPNLLSMGPSHGVAKARASPRDHFAGALRTFDRRSGESLR